MADSPVLYALRRKRAELSGQIADLESQATVLRSELIHVDACLRMFGYDEEPETSIRPIRPKRVSGKSLFAHASYPAASSIVSAATPKASPRAPWSRNCAEKGWATDDQQLSEALVNKVNHKLRMLAKRGLIRAEGERGCRKTWRLVG